MYVCMRTCLYEGKKKNKCKKKLMKQELLCYQSVFKILSPYLFLAVLGLHCYMTFSLAVVSGGCSLVAVQGLLIVEHGLQVFGLQCL